MADEKVFSQVDSESMVVLDELRSREPIFHTKGFGQTIEDFERSTAPDFWEVGASGRRYSREFILEMRGRESLVDADDSGWKASGFGLRQLGPNCYLLTYTLDQAGRLTRRATIWERTAGHWRILYHQGTIVTATQDNSLPSPEEMQPESRQPS
jgi:hypothetical protein